MDSFMKKLTAIFLIIQLMLLSAAVQAAESQFYFLARMAPAGSISAEGQAQNVVYLRWDFVEGRLPPEIVRFSLRKNGVEIANLPAHSVMSAAQIRQLYQGGAQKQRRLETISRLNELAAAKGDNFSPDAFADYLQGLIDPASSRFNPLWAFLGSRTDFNVARARHHAWIDDNPGIGPIEYELLAMNAQGQTARLGLASVDPLAPGQILGASNLRQVYASKARCDLPEDKDNYTVMLNWDSPATINNPNIADRVASQLYLSGFDIYRGTDALAAGQTAPVRDIAVLAAQSPVDNQGRPQIAGLEKVNNVLILDAGNTSEPKWLEARDKLKRAGLKPGDRRAYYLVARDFTGNYGPSQSVVVEIPDSSRPPAPWSLRPYANETDSMTVTRLDGVAEVLGKGMLLSWNAINLENYIDHYGNSRVICNAVEALNTDILEYVLPGQSCEQDARHRVRLDVNDYRVYRFNDFDIASRFQDSDGDGFSDADERPYKTQCDISQAPPAPANVRSYLAPAQDIDLYGSSDMVPGTQTVLMRDRRPEQERDKVFWYRIASSAGLMPNISLSYLTPPRRVLFPSRELPAEPSVSATYSRNIPGCRPVVENGGNWRFEDHVISTAAGVPARVPPQLQLNCALLKSPMSVSVAELQDAESFSCNALKACQGLDVSVTYPQPYNCSFTLANSSICDSGQLRVEPTYDSSVQVDARAGDIVGSGATITVTPVEADTCVALYQDNDGVSTRVATSCGAGAGGISYTPGPGVFCGYAVSMDENNNISTARQIPCMQVILPGRLTPPLIQRFSVDSQAARMRLKLPAQKIASILLELSQHTAGAVSATDTFSLPAISAEAGEIINHLRSVAPLASDTDRFCLRARSVGPEISGAGNFSDWSKEKCYQRSALNRDAPVYMPWPEIAALEQREAIEGAVLARYRAHRFLMVLDLADISNFIGSETDCYSNGVVYPDNSIAFDELLCSDDGLRSMQALVKPALGFVLYRQGRDSSGQAGDWVQVSPLIDRVHFDYKETGFAKQNIRWRLNDPFVNYFIIDAQTGYPYPAPTQPAVENGHLKFVFIDRYPTLMTAERNQYRYQAVYFADGRPLYYRQSDWLEVLE